jgi:hypothetical protein
MSDETPRNNPDGGIGWRQWSQGVQDSMKTLENRVSELDKKVNGHREESLINITTLKVKAGLMGTIAGVIASAIMSVLVGFVIYQLTTGNIHFDGEENHSGNTIGFILPPRDDHHDPLYKIISEAET